MQVVNVLEAGMSYDNDYHVRKVYQDYGDAEAAKKIMLETKQYDWVEIYQEAVIQHV